MLLNTDLGLWTRACVNLLLAEVSPVHVHQDKSMFATEALRIVNQLQQGIALTEMRSGRGNTKGLKETLESAW